MKKRLWVFSLLILTAVIVSACNPTPADPNQPAVESEPMMEGTLEEQQPADDAGPALAPESFPLWFSIEMTDVNTGMVFTVADFQGKVVLVETMAIWCPKCLTQQKEVYRLHDILGDRDDFVSLGINTDPNEDSTQLSAYVKNNRFDWLYVVASNELINEIGELYGSQYLNPPSTPMLIIDRQGKAHLLPFGIKSAEELQSLLLPFLEEV
jgi:cytochrome oxidase Cu insertion factor (SCO1/SenC/PrrC family)